MDQVKRLATGAGTGSAGASKNSDGDCSLESDASNDTEVAPPASRMSTLPSKSQLQAFVGGEEEKGDGASQEDYSGGNGVGSTARVGSSQQAKRQKVEVCEERRGDCNHLKIDLNFK